MEGLEASSGDATNPSSSDGVAWPPCSLLLGYPDDIDSAYSTPYYSAPSSPGRSHPGYYFSAPASPMLYVLSSASQYTASAGGEADGSFEFEFSSRFPDLCDAGSAAAAAGAGSMISADELFLNGQIRPMRLAGHLQRPQALAPLMDLEEEKGEEHEGGVRGMRKGAECEELGGARGRDLGLRCRSLHRRARSMSPLRSAPAFRGWQEEEEEEEERRRLDSCSGMSASGHGTNGKQDRGEEEEDQAAAATTPPGSASASRSSSSSSSSCSSSSSIRNAKPWMFLKDFLYRSKSEGRASGKEKFWHNISFSPTGKEKTSSLLFFSNKAAKSKEGSVKADTDRPAAASSCTPEPSAELKKKQKKQSSSSTTTACATPDPGTSTTSFSKSNSNCSESKKSTTTASSSHPVNGVVRKRRKPAPSPHERHYAAKRAQAEELRRRTFLPYRQGLLSCLGFSSRGYYAMNGLARTLNTVSSR